MLDKLENILKSIVFEVLIIFIYIFLVNNYIGNVEKTIKADAIGYYDYLPSTFIHHDLLRKDIPINKDSLHLYSRINELGVYSKQGNFKADKYPCGTAVLELPFFISTYLWKGTKDSFNDGYQEPYQKAIFYAAIFYLFFSALFLRKTLELYNIKRGVIILSQTLLVLGTAVTNYVNYDAGFSHVYSLFAITAFIFFTKSFFINRKVKHFILACLFFGLILIIRQVNVLILLFVPFLAESLGNLKEGVLIIFNKKKVFFLGILLVIAIFFIQSLLWFLQTGSLFIYSYTGEGFDFSSPEMIKILFSYKKGLFIYTPIVFIAFLATFWFIIKKRYYLFFSWVSFFLVLTYILSSWWSWFYGMSYGLRAYIDYYPVFFIPFALLLNHLKGGLKYMIIVLSLLTIPVNIIQTYQYKEYILHGIDMDKEKYWKVFLQTEDKYKGLVWQKEYDFSQYEIIQKIEIGESQVKANEYNILFTLTNDSISSLCEANIVQVSFDNNFNRENNTELILSVDEVGGGNLYWHKVSILHYSKKSFGTYQKGVYNYEMNIPESENNYQMKFEVVPGNEDCIMRDIQVKLLKRKQQ